MIYEFTPGLTLLKNKEDWEKFCHDKTYSHPNSFDGPKEYPCLVFYYFAECSNWHDSAHDEDVFQFIYPQDAANLITEKWNIEDETNSHA